MIRDLILANRSCRGYDESRRVTRQELEQMVDCARLSASSVNLQPLRYCLVYEREKVAQILPHTKWAARLPELALPRPGKHPAAFIVICQDTSVARSLAQFQKDVGIAAQSILLCAVEMGLGGCMIGSFNAAALRQALALPERIAPLLVVAIGKPAEQIVLTPVGEDGSVAYWRDENDVHYVPKRALEDVILGEGDK